MNKLIQFVVKVTWSLNPTNQLPSSVVRSLVCPFVNSLDSSSLPPSLRPSGPSFLCSFAGGAWFIRFSISPFVRSFVRSFDRSFVSSFVVWLVGWLVGRLVRPSVCPPVRPSVRSFVRSSVCSFVCSFVRPLVPSSVPSFESLFVHSSIHWFTVPSRLFLDSSPVAKVRDSKEVQNPAS